MRTRPPGLTDDDVRAALAHWWAVDAGAVTYRPVGFGSHHWDVRAGDDRWFLTVDDLDAKRRHADEPRHAARSRLDVALTAARALADRGLSFVVAPIPTAGGDVVAPIDQRFAGALYPHVAGTAREWGELASRDDRLAVLELVVAVHAEADIAACTDDLTVPMRAELHAAIDDVGQPWSSGPYAERARALLAHHADGLERLLDHHDRGATAVAARPERMVLTHGEPHPGNTMVTAAGLALVDWDTALLAPPERDLWTVAGGDRTVLAAYTERTGRAVLDDVLATYRLWWDVAEVALYIALLRAQHDDSADVQESWRNLQHFLDPVGRWPALTS